MPSIDASITAKIEAARDELLDLSFRNPLLNYRPLKSRGAELLGGDGPRILTALQDGRKLRFSSTDKTSAYLTLATLYSSDELQKRLLKTLYDARSSLQEQGVNTLFLAFGTLRWFEADQSDEAHMAPLLLLPVEISRANAGADFELAETHEDSGFNLSLAVRLERDFGIKLPLLTDEDDVDLADYFAKVQEAVAGQSRWQVNPDFLALAFFSFSKFLMFRDLEEEAWPDHAKPSAHPILGALLKNGFKEPAAAFSDDQRLDPVLPPQKAKTVTDADSSQLLAIEDTKAGRNLVIQGPPGTGKSQTITNIIAEALGQGKTVLFVAEKLAALDVVKKRLDSLGLGDACLELHSHKANKKTVLGELKRTFELEALPVSQSSGIAEKLSESIFQLNRYSEAINQPIGQAGLSLYDLYGQWLQLQETKLRSGLEIPLLSLSDWSQKTPAENEKALRAVTEIELVLKRMGSPAAHPFFGSGLTSFLPSDVDATRRRSAATLEASQSAQTAGARLAEVFGQPPFASYAEAKTGEIAATRWMRAPDLSGTTLDDESWTKSGAEISTILEAGTRLSELSAANAARLSASAWGVDVTAALEAVRTHGLKWYRWFYGSWHGSQRLLAELASGAPPSEPATQIELLEAIVAFQHEHAIIMNHRDLAIEFFGPSWKDLGTNFEALKRAAQWLTESHELQRRGALPSWFFGHKIENSAGLQSALSASTQATRALEGSWQELATALRLTQPEIGEQSFVQFDALLAKWRDNAARLAEMATFNTLAAELHGAGLDAVLELANTWEDATQGLVLAFRTATIESLLREAMEHFPELGRFNGEGHETQVAEFQRSDREYLRSNGAGLARAHRQQLPRSDMGTAMKVLRHEWGKQRAHKPPRRLMVEAGSVIQTIKPVFMMSPLSVATYLAPGAVKFDLVVFDEASQVRPVDAFGALLRGSQSVVAGDSKQLPPTSFFDKLGDESDDDDEENNLGEMESILGLFAAQGAPQRMLRWHYRSRHESLIAVSNQEFYENRLVIFPSPDAARETLGLVYRYLPDTVYDRGVSGTNRAEAVAVANAVMEHARAQVAKPQASWTTLGVAAFSVKQAEEIRDQIEIQRIQFPECEAFFSEAQHEAFFVKNLENVQGDERDIIFISIGYGRDGNGKLAMNFGPLNGTGGERRLNVLITRARLRCEIFTNLSPDDIDLSRTSAPGVHALKQFLAYAKNGHLSQPTPSGREPDSPFEREVIAALRAMNYDVVPQVGCAGYFIDIAVKDPQHPGCYVLGIECDGATYHSARSARDRDRLRAEVLGRMGWQLHRIWSTDWFRHPEAQKKRLTEAVELACAAANEALSSHTP